MDFNVIKELWYDFLFFMDRVMGWIAYTIGGADDPYSYDSFWENIFGVHVEDTTNAG